MNRVRILLEVAKGLAPKLFIRWVIMSIPAIVYAALLTKMINRDFMDNKISYTEAFQIGCWLGPVVLLGVMIIASIIGAIVVLVRKEEPYST